MNQTKSRTEAIRTAIAKATHITHDGVKYRLVSVNGDEVYAVSEDPCVEGEGDYAILTVYGLLCDREVKIENNATLYTHEGYDVPDAASKCSRVEQARKALTTGAYVMYKGGTYRLNGFDGKTVDVETPDGCAPYTFTVEEFCEDPSSKVLALHVSFGSTSVGATDWSAA